MPSLDEHTPTLCTGWRCTHTRRRHSWAPHLPACTHLLACPRRDQLLCWVGGDRVAATFCSDLFLPNLFLPLPSSIPSRATLNLQSAGLQQGCGQAETKLGTDSKLGLQRDRWGNVSLLRTSCLVSPWYDQTCTASGPVPGSSAASLWPFCCPQTCHLEWLLDSGYGSCRDKAEGGHEREPQHSQWLHHHPCTPVMPVAPGRTLLQLRLEPCMNQELQAAVWALLQSRHQGTLPDLSP